MQNNSSNREYYIDWMDWLWYSAPDLGAASGMTIEPVIDFNDIVPIAGRAGAMRSDDSGFQEALRMEIRDKVLSYLVTLDKCVIFDMESEESDFLVCYRGKTIAVRVTMDADLKLTETDKAMVEEMKVAGGYFKLVNRLWDFKEFIESLDKKGGNKMEKYGVVKESKEHPGHTKHAEVEGKVLKGKDVKKKDVK